MSFNLDRRTEKLAQILYGLAVFFGAGYFLMILLGMIFHEFGFLVPLGYWKSALMALALRWVLGYPQWIQRVKIVEED